MGNEHSTSILEGTSFTITPFYADTKLQNVLAPEDLNGDYSDDSEHSVSRSRTPRRGSLSRTPQLTPRSAARKGHSEESKKAKAHQKYDSAAVDTASVLVQTESSPQAKTSPPEVTFSAGNAASLRPLTVDHAPSGHVVSPTMSREVRALSLSYLPRGATSSTIVERMPLVPVDCPALPMLIGETATAAIASLLPPASNAPQAAPAATLAALARPCPDEDSGLTLRFRPTIRNTRLLGGLRHPCLVVILLRAPISGALSMTPIAAARCVTPFPLPGATGLLFPPIVAEVPASIRAEITASAVEKGHPDVLAGLTWLIALTSAEKAGSAPSSQAPSPSVAGLSGALAGGAITGCERVMAVVRVPARAWADRVAAVKSKAESLPTGQKVDGALSFKRPMQHPTNSLEWAGIFSGEDTHLVVEPLFSPSQPMAPALVEEDDDEDVLFDAFAANPPTITPAPVSEHAPEEPAQEQQSGFDANEALASLIDAPAAGEQVVSAEPAVAEADRC